MFLFSECLYKFILFLLIKKLHSTHMDIILKQKIVKGKELIIKRIEFYNLA